MNALATVGAVLTGGVGATLLQLAVGWFRRRGDAVVNDQTEFRKELWKEIGELRGELRRVTGELRETKEAYVQLLGEHGALKAEHARLERDHHELNQKYDALKAQIERTSP